MIASHRPNLWQAWNMCPMSDEITYSSMVLVRFETASKQRIDHRVLPQVASISLVIFFSLMMCQIDVLVVEQKI